MKYIIHFLVLLFFVQQPAHAQQTNSQNYIISRSYKQTGADANDVSKVLTQVQYLDALGRPIQNVTVGQSPAGTDVVQPVEYDAVGRQAKQYLPYVASGNGSFKSNSTSSQAAWYLANSAGLQAGFPTSLDLNRPYSETIFQPSPLNRPSNGQGPGTKSPLTYFGYGSNTGQEINMYQYSPNADIFQTISVTSSYPEGSLYLTQTNDENNYQTLEFKDRQDRLVCKRVFASTTEVISTYYVYDNINQLRAILQPQYQEGSDPVSVKLANFAFLYDYDEKQRVIKKYIPGAGLTEFVYDNYDHQVLSRNAGQAARNVWGFTKFDVLNRPVMTGELASDKSRSDWQTKYNAVTVHHENKQGTTGVGYTLNLTSVSTATGFPQISEGDVMTVTYYDDYNFPKPTGFDYSSSTGYPASANTAVKTMVTGGKARILAGGSATAGEWRTNIIYYDTEYRTIQTVRDLYDLGASPIERVSIQYKYDLAPIIAQQKTVQIVAGVTHSHEAIYNYDHADRLMNVKETVISGAKTKTAYTLAQQYNTLGQLKNKWFHAYSSSELKYRRRTDYVNNIRGWVVDGKTVYKDVEGSSDLPFFRLTLAYDNIAGSHLYSNGNISSMLWNGKNETTLSKGLSFNYDLTNRLTGAIGLDGYADTESGITYDLNGNIKTLNRTGTSVDNLTYNYSGTGNRLNSITDASGSITGVKNGTSTYVYDANGNMTSDGNRGAELTYNYLNLPKTITISGKTLTYDYDASGIKHKFSGDGITSKYAGIFEYDANNAFKRVSTSEGQLVPGGDTLRFDYYIKDHLGNVRVVFNEFGDIIQKTDYLPFGLEVDRNTPASSVTARNAINKYNFLGKETQIGSGYIDLSKRFYDPSIGRFMQVDPVTESQEDQSVYQYGWNNPILRSDPNGDCPGPPCGNFIKTITNPITTRNLKYATESQKSIGSIKIGVGFGEGYGIRAFGREAKIDAFFGFNEVKIGSGGVSLEANAVKVSAGVDLGLVKPGAEVKLGNVNIDFAAGNGSVSPLDGTVGLSRESKGSNTALNNNGDSDASISAGPVSVGVSGSLEAIRNTLTGYIKAVGGYVQAMTTEITNNTFKTDPKGRSTEQFIKEEREPKR